MRAGGSFRLLSEEIDGRFPDPAVDLNQLLSRCDSTTRLQVLWEQWVKVPSEQRPTTFLDTFQISDRSARWMVVEMLQSMQLPIFDSEAARDAYQELPAKVCLFRGAHRDESSNLPLGISWTLSESQARFFAFEHRFRPEDGAVLKAKVTKTAIAAMIWERGEKEILVLPRRIRRRDVSSAA